jgi:hypothetical protein
MISCGSVSILLRRAKSCTECMTMSLAGAAARCAYIERRQSPECRSDSRRLIQRPKLRFRGEAVDGNAPPRSLARRTMGAEPANFRHRATRASDRVLLRGLLRCPIASEHPR